MSVCAACVCVPGQPVDDVALCNLFLTLPCREVDGYNPYVEFENGTFIPAQSAKFCSQDAQATQTSEIAATTHVEVNAQEWSRESVTGS